MAPIQQQTIVSPPQLPTNSYQYIKNTPQQPLFMKQQQQQQVLLNTPTPLPQRIRPISFQNNESTQASNNSNINNNGLSKRFSNINPTPAATSVQLQLEQQKMTLNTKALSVITDKQSSTSASSKVAVDTSLIHQALFTNQNPKANQNPVTFTVKI